MHRLVLVDRQRPEPATADTADRREVVAHVWYPAVPRTGTPSSYVADSGAWVRAYGAGWVRRARAVRPTARAGATPEPGLRRLVLLSPAAGADPGNYAVLGEELASRGFVVVALGHPYEAPVMRLMDGTLAAPVSVPDSLFVQVSREQVRRRAGDMRFVLGQVYDTTSPVIRQLTGLRVDPRQVVALGHSRGGVAAIEACKSHEGLRACANMDGGVFGGPYYEDSIGGRPRAPVLWLQAWHPPPSDAQLARWQMSRARWDTFDIRANRLLSRARGGGWRLTLADTLHQAFSDLGWLRAQEGRAAMQLATLLDVRALVAEYAESSLEGRPPAFEAAIRPEGLRSVLRLPDAD